MSVNCIKCGQQLNAPPIFQLLPPPPPPPSFYSDTDSILFKCKVKSSVISFIEQTTHSSMNNNDTQTHSQFDSFLIFIVIAFVFAIILVFSIIFIVSYFRQKLLHNENYLKSLRSSSSSSSSTSSCTNSTNLNDSLINKNMLKVVIDPVSTTHSLYNTINSASYNYYQRVYSEINDTECQHQHQVLAIDPTNQFVYKIPIYNLNNQQSNTSNIHFSYA